jgi:hypothetical protein
MKSRWTNIGIGAALVAGALAAVAFYGNVLAQGGSAGGSVGKIRKSFSGGEPQPKADLVGVVLPLAIGYYFILASISSSFCAGRWHSLGVIDECRG